MDDSCFLDQTSVANRANSGDFRTIVFGKLHRINANSVIACIDLSQETNIEHWKPVHARLGPLQRTPSERCSSADFCLA